MDALEQYKVEFQASMDKAYADIGKLSDRLNDVGDAAQTAGKNIDKVGTSSRGVSNATSNATRAAGALRAAGSEAVALGGKLATVGNRANRMLSGLSPIGTVLGLGAASDLAYLAVAGIQALAASIHTLQGDADKAAGAIQGLYAAELGVTDAFFGSVGAVKSYTDAQADLKDATRDSAAADAAYAAAQKGRVVDQAKVTSLTNQHHAALLAVQKATISRGTAERALSVAISKHGADSVQAANATDRLKKADLTLTGAHQRETAVLKELDKARRGTKATQQDLTQIADKKAAADKRAVDATIQSGAAANGVAKAFQAQVDAQAKVVEQQKAVQRIVDTLNRDTQANTGTRLGEGRGTASPAAVIEGAHRYAEALRHAADSQKGLSAETKKGIRDTADLIDHMGKVPKDVATKITTPGREAAQQGVDAFHQAIAGLPPEAKSKVEALNIAATLGATVTLNDVLNAINGKNVTATVTVKRRGNITNDIPSAIGVATGGYFPGQFDGADNIPIWVSKGEAVLNPRQINLVDSGMSVGQALAATNAPGASFMSSHKHGLDYRKAKLDLEGAIRDERAARKAHGAGSYEDRQARLAVEQARKDFRDAARAERHPADRDVDSFLGNSILDQLARAASTLDPKDDQVAAGRAAAKLEAILRHGSFHGRRLSRTERRSLLEALGGYRRDAKPDDTTSGGPGDNPNLDQYLEFQRIQSVAETALGLTLQGAGSLGMSTAGAGGFLSQGAATAAGAQHVIIQTLHPGDPNTLNAISRVVTKAQGRQGYQPRTRRRMGVL